MGCTNTRDNIEAKMLELKLRRIQIRKERMQRCQELSKFTGQIVKRKPIKNFLVSKKMPEPIQNKKQNLSQEVSKKNKRGANKKIFNDKLPLIPNQKQSRSTDGIDKSSSTKNPPDFQNSNNQEIKNNKHNKNEKYDDEIKNDNAIKDVKNNQNNEKKDSGYNNKGNNNDYLNDENEDIYLNNTNDNSNTNNNNHHHCSLNRELRNRHGSNMGCCYNNHGNYCPMNNIHGVIHIFSHNCMNHNCSQNKPVEKVDVEKAYTCNFPIFHNPDLIQGRILIQPPKTTSPVNYYY